MNKKIASVKGDDKGSIDELIAFLNDCKNKGATHYKMTWSGDPIWAFKWFEAYKVMSDEEVKNKEIEDLESKLKHLKGK